MATFCALESYGGMGLQNSDCIVAMNKNWYGEMSGEKGALLVCTLYDQCDQQSAKVENLEILMSAKSQGVHM